MSKYTKTGAKLVIFNSFNKPFNQVISETILPRVLYSTLKEDCEILIYLLDFHAIRAPTNLIIYLVTNLRDLGQEA